MSWIDLELAQAISLSTEALIDLERKLEKIERKDLLEDSDKNSIQNPRTAGLVLYAVDEPYAVLRMEDIWVEGNILTEPEKKVVEKAVSMLTFPHRYVEGDKNVT